MSESRQHFTGNIGVFFLSWMTLVVMFWWLPRLLIVQFPELAISQTEPWMMSPEDLNWKRAIVNVITKPGFRLITAAILGMICSLIRQLLLWGFRGRQLSLGPLRWSGEWLMDGGMQSTLLEYGQWVGVVR